MTIVKPANIDTFGHCVLCGKNMIIHQVINGKVQQRLGPDYVEEEYLLSDKSKMRVAMCRGCRDNLTGDENTIIMEAVLNGWKNEVETYSHWPEERKMDYIKRYSKKKIVVRTAGLREDVLDKKHKEFIKKEKDKEKIK